MFPSRRHKRKYRMARILVADDDALIGEVVFHILEEHGHNVAVADNGAQALEMVGLEKPDIIILDNLMPGLRGVEVLAHLQNQEETATIPVIMLTAQKGRNHVVEAYDAGVTDYMTKPFEPACLVARVSDMIGNLRIASASTGQSL